MSKTYKRIVFSCEYPGCDEVVSVREDAMRKRKTRMCQKHVNETCDHNVPSGENHFHYKGEFDAYGLHWVPRRVYDKNGEYNRYYAKIICDVCDTDFERAYPNYKKCKNKRICPQCTRKNNLSQLGKIRDKFHGWKGGLRKDSRGYWQVKLYPGDLYYEMGNKGTHYTPLHRYMKAIEIGRAIKPYEDVHHRDRQKNNCCWANLTLEDKRTHTEISARDLYIDKLEQENVYLRERLRLCALMA